MPVAAFSGTVLLLISTLSVVKMKCINRYLKSKYYYCWVILLVSNLGYPHYFQLGFRFLAVILSLFVVVRNGKGRVRYRANANLALLWIYLSVCLLSTIWSVYPAQTLFKSIELITTLLVLQSIYAREGSRQLFIRKITNVTMTVVLVLLGVTLTGFFLAPSYFANNGYSASVSYLGRRIGEGILGANSSSALAAMVIAWLVLIRNKPGVRTWCAIGLCLGVMLFAQSRASLALIPIIVTLRFFRPKNKNLIMLTLFAVISAAVAITHLDIIIAYLLRGQNAYELSSFSGREMMWSYAFDYIWKKPLLGYGFGAGGEMVGKMLPGLFNGMQHMHNGYIESLLGTGVVGTLILVIQYVIATVMVFNNTLRYGLKGNLFDCFIIVYFLIRSISSLGFASWQSPELMIWFVFFVSLKSGKSFQNAFTSFEEQAGVST